jgi:hypothetical protein
MSDRELLESAATAVGITGTYARAHQAYGDQWIDGIDAGGPVYWNPLTVDGDAFRLSVELDISVRQQFAMVTAEYPWVDDDLNTRKVLCEGVGALNDYCAATRRAIVRAAAEIGSRVDAPQSAA